MRHHIPALDGLRAVACLAVVAIHSNLPGTSGGWIGVDLFFVLSGYLITGLLLDELRESGRIQLPRFWARRAARLYPALVVTVALVAVIPGVRDHDPYRFSVVAAIALTYTTDFALGLFGPIGDGTTHLWSLAVEEQFYLLWPLMVFALRGRRRLLAVTVVVGAGSLAAMLFDPTISAWLPRVYWMPQSRAWELLAGAWLAIAAPQVSNRARSVASVIGAAMFFADLAVANFIPQSTSPVLVAEAVTAVVASVLLITGSRGPGLVTTCLSWKPAVWLGKRTYGVYLYSLPMALLVAWATPWRRLVEVIIYIPLTVALAAISYVYERRIQLAVAPRFMERPATVILLPIESASAAHDS